MQVEQTLSVLGTAVCPTETAAKRDALTARRAALSAELEAAVATVDIPASQSVVPRQRYIRNAAIAFAALLGAIALAYHTAVFDRPISRFVNQWAHRSVVLDTAIWSLDACFLFSGFVFTAFIWFCWFANKDEGSRARLVVGTLVAFPAGCVSRLMQHTVPSHPRPFYDQLLHFRGPYLLGDKPLNTWNSFPSDHVTVFAALLTIICIVRPKLAKFLIPYFIVVESARIYMGVHYTSDVLGGAALGALVIWAMQTPRITELGRRVLRWEASSPGLFYMAAFAVTWGTSNLFLEPRTIGSYLLHAIRHT